MPQFAYQPHRRLSDALGRAVQHVTDVRAACKRHRRTRRELKRGKIQLEGGICFALDLSQAFDMVDPADLIATLEQAHTDPAIVDLVASLLAGSRYGIKAQGEATHVTSTTGIKQGCKLSPTLFSMLTGTMFRELTQLAGTEAVLRFLTGYADDLTVHRDIHSWQDLLRAHQLITDLLVVVRRHGFQVNANKCSVMLKLVGRQAATAYKQFTYWRTASDGTMHRMWRLGSTKAQEGFPFVNKIKYLGVKLSYGNFEKATLQYRLQEGNVKLQQVRKYVHNRRTSGPKARLHIWNATVWATVASGLVDVGLTTDTATKLRARHAAKIRAGLNKPAHLTHISTADLYKQYGIKDPVQKLADRQANRVKRLEQRSRIAPQDDVSTAPAALEQARQKLKQYRDLLTQQLSTVGALACPCPICDQVFETPTGLRTHVGKMHPGTVDRFVPTAFRQEHAVSGLPQCAACMRHFSQWKGLKDHLLSGACPEPEKLRQLGTALHPRQQMLRNTVLTHTALAVGRTDQAQDFLSYCALCGFWTADHTKIKSHIRQAHRTQWSSHGQATTEACKRAGIPLIKGQPRPCCRKTVHDKNGHASQCPVLFQIPFYDLAHGLKRTNKHLLDAHFRALPRTETPALRRPPSFDSPADPPACPGGADGEPPRLPRPLLNPSNYCYVNALLRALIPTGILTAASAPAAALHRELLSTGQMRPQCGSVLRSAHPHPQMAL